MPIEFLDLLDASDDDAWEPWRPQADAGEQLVDGEAWESTRIDSSFGLTGVRLAPGTSVQRHRHNRSLLLLVFDGMLELSHLDDDGDETTALLRAGQFCVIDADTVHRLGAGPQGVIYLSSWPLEAPDLVTTWEGT